MSTTPDLTAVLHKLGPQFAKGVAERDADAAFVAENYDALKQHKVFSAMVPQELGGGGVPHSEMCGFLRKLAPYCSSTALALSMHQHLVAAAVFNYRNGRPGQKLLERVADGEAVLVSTGANDWLDSNGSVTRVDGGFRLSYGSLSRAIVDLGVIGRIEVRLERTNPVSKGRVRGERAAQFFQPAAEQHVADFFRVGCPDVGAALVAANLLQRIGNARGLARELYG